ncbi:MAG: ribosome biogenesis GTPase YlqF [Tissierellia bacterium]|nr:ribosome biogenesis GTPase YlqF [Tissierellia bacterium]
MNINWYPGHMKVTMEQLQSSLRLVDIVMEVIDARIPKSSRNPNLDDILQDKPRIVALNKSDLADPDENNRWRSHYESLGYGVLMMDALHNRGLGDLKSKSEEVLEAKRARDASRGILDTTIKMMIVGIPNVGKSTIINTISKRSGAKVGNLPGVTRTNQWIKTNKGIELLDTPGVLWPKFEDREVGINLAITGAITDRILDVEDLAFELIKKLQRIDPAILPNRYGISEEIEEPLQMMEEIAQRRGAILKRGEIDYFKIANVLLGEFRKGTLGRITLEEARDA